MLVHIILSIVQFLVYIIWKFSVKKKIRECPDATKKPKVMHSYNMTELKVKYFFKNILYYFTFSLPIHLLPDIVTILQVHSPTEIPLQVI